MVCCNNVFLLQRFRDITAFTYYFTGCDLDKSFSFNTTLEITCQVYTSDGHILNQISVPNHRQLLGEEEKLEKISYSNDLHEALLRKDGKCSGTVVVGRPSSNHRCPARGLTVVWITVSLGINNWQTIFDNHIHATTNTGLAPHYLIILTVYTAPTRVIPYTAYAFRLVCKDIALIRAVLPSERISKVSNSKSDLQRHYGHSGSSVLATFDMPHTIPY